MVLVVIRACSVVIGLIEEKGVIWNENDLKALWKVRALD